MSIRKIKSRLVSLVPALVEPVDPENVDVRQTVPLPDGNGGVGNWNDGFRSRPSKGGSTNSEI